MLISALMPIFGEPIREILTQLFRGNQTPQNLEQLLSQIEKKTLPANVRLELMNAAAKHWNEEKQPTEATKKTVLPKPEDRNSIL